MFFLSLPPGPQVLVDWVHISWLMLNIRAKVAVIQVVFDSYQYFNIKRLGPCAPG